MFYTLRKALLVESFCSTILRGFIATFNKWLIEWVNSKSPASEWPCSRHPDLILKSVVLTSIFFYLTWIWSQLKRYFTMPHEQNSFYTKEVTDGIHYLTFNFCPPRAFPSAPLSAFSSLHLSLMIKNTSRIWKLLSLALLGVFSWLWSKFWKYISIHWAENFSNVLLSVILILQILIGFDEC